MSSHHQTWKLSNFKEKYQSFYVKAKDMQQIQKINFDTLDSESFIDVLFYTAHPLELKGYTNILSPVQKAITIAIYQHGGRATEDQIVDFIVSHWKDIQNVSKSGFAREPDVRLLHVNEKIKKSEAYIFIRDPKNSKYVMVNDVSRRPYQKSNESKSKDSEEKGKKRGRSNDEPRPMALKFAYTSRLYEKEHLFASNFVIPTELEKKITKEKKSSKLSQYHSHQDQPKLNSKPSLSVINPAFISALDSTEINISMTPSEKLLCYTLPQVKVNYKVDINEIEIPESLTFDEKVLHIVKMCANRNRTGNTLHDGVTSQAIADKLRPFANDPGKFNNLPINIRVRAILLEAKQLDLVDDGYSGRQELWFWKHPQPSKPTFPCSSIENKYRLLMPKPFSWIRVREIPVNQLYEKIHHDKSFGSKLLEFVP